MYLFNRWPSSLLLLLFLFCYCMVSACGGSTGSEGSGETKDFTLVAPAGSWTGPATAQVTLRLPIGYEFVSQEGGWGDVDKQSIEGTFSLKGPHTKLVINLGSGFGKPVVTRTDVKTTFIVVYLSTPFSSMENTFS